MISASICVQFRWLHLIQKIRTKQKVDEAFIVAKRNNKFSILMLNCKEMKEKWTKREKKIIKSICICTSRHRQHQLELILLNIPKVSAENNTEKMHNWANQVGDASFFLPSAPPRFWTLGLADDSSLRFFEPVPAFFGTCLSRFLLHVSISVCICRVTGKRVAFGLFHVLKKKHF